MVDAARQMIQQEKGPPPALESELPVAIVTDRDIVAHVAAEGRDPSSTTVDDIASHELVTVGPDQDVDEARRLMAQHQPDRILMSEGERLVGIISEADIRSDEAPLAQAPARRTHLPSGPLGARGGAGGGRPGRRPSVSGGRKRALEVARAGRYRSRLSRQLATRRRER